MIIAFSFLLALRLATAPAMAPGPDANVDVVHYLFELDLTDESDEIRGVAHVSARFLAPGIQALRLNLINATEDGGMEVDHVTLDGTTLAFSHQNDQLVISLTEAPAEGDERTVVVQYHGVPADGLIIAENIHGDRTFFGDNWPNRARHWLPTVDHPSDKATVEFKVRAPNHYQVIGSGLLIEESDVDDTTRLSHWRTTIPMATKVMVIGVARFATELVDQVQGIPISSWVYPQDREGGFENYAIAPRIFRYFLDRIGPFPYLKLANVQSKTRYGGMENAGNIFYSERTVGGRSVEGLFAHEIAHQWFGDSVSEADWPHIWLSEGFATYFTQLYLEHTYGPARLAQGMAGQRDAVLGFYDRNPDAPLVNYEESDPNRLLNTNSYQKGSWVLHMLRNKVGDEAFREGTKAYYRELRDTNASSEDFRRYMERASGMDLDGFFDQWVFSLGQPELKLEWTWSAGSVSVSVSESHATEFTFPLEVAFHLPDGSTQVETIQVEGPWTQASFSVAVQPSSIELDPSVRLLMRNSQN